MKKEVTIRAKIYDIDKPLQVVKMATIVKNHIIKNNLYVPIKGKNYVMVEGWQFAGGMLGLVPRVVEVKQMAKGEWFAQVNIIDKRTGCVISSGFALCSKAEDKKKGFDEYAILSMAQTRAIGKAYRNLIGWVMKLAGYEGTPAEEMKGKVDEATTTPAGKILAGEKEKKDIEKYCRELGYSDPEKAFDFIKKITGIEFNERLTKTDATTIIAALLQKQTAKRNGKKN